MFGTKSTKRIDLYKRDCFVLEAKQSYRKPGEIIADEPAPGGKTIFDLFGNPVGIAPATDKLRPRYDRLMSDARLQAERYVLALPDQHRAPPFLIVADIGRSFELYFDWSGNGRGFAPFPNERSYRIGLGDLTSAVLLPDVKQTAAETLRAIWTDPASIDPRLRAAEVTRDIAARLSRVAAQLEKDERDRHPGDAQIALGIEATSLFLMRMLFCMFAEDVELLPKDSFKRFLEEAKGKSDLFWSRGIQDLWSRMNDPHEANRYWSFGDAVVRYFNGNLFSNTSVFDLPSEFKNELFVAAGKDWRAVEPAIFGTLLEQVLTTKDRAKLGAHYTPRAYVERLVEAVILDVLRPEWEAVLEGARAKIEAGDSVGAVDDARAFHRRLCAVRVLDPACGTANFLYVAMEQLLRLEGEVRVFAAGLGEEIAPEVHPNQFLGLELNPRAAVIAELVLWIGWLRYRLANSPEADFIVGNPPFIGGKDIRDRLGSETAEALWRANPRVPKSADFVMHWWDRAADILTREGTRLRRFGFVTTNSITQVFSRRVIEGWLSSPERGVGPPPQAGVEGVSQPSSGPCDEAPPSASPPPPRAGEEQERKLHLVLAIPDHPWTRVTKDAAAVRIAMTVGQAGAGPGKLVRITGERGIDSDAPELDEEPHYGAINADLSVGTDVTRVVPLKANEGVCHDGVKLHGKGFSITGKLADALGLRTRPGLASHIRPYRNGRDLAGRTAAEVSDKFVIDFFEVSEADIQSLYPEAYQHLLKSVKPERDLNRRETYRRNWWTFGEPRRELRPAIASLKQYIATVDTARHRLFQFLDASVICDDKVVVIAMAGGVELGVLSSAIHVNWSIATGGWLGFGNDSVYVKTRVFDPFPFPAATPEQSAAIATVAERLDDTRRAALAEDDRLTMTGLYNLVAAIRDGTLDPQDEAKAVRARARIVAKLHDELDAAVAAAYGWGEEWAKAPLPPAEIVARLVALNAERAAEEQAGTVRWLRPDYQIPRFG